MDTTIKVIDSIMGSGKTTYIKNMINHDKDNKYIFITPYLKQIEDKDNNSGIINDCLDLDFKQPKHLGNGKLSNLHDLIINNENIATTHSLFTNATIETYELLKMNEYIIIIDEVLQLTDTINISLSDYLMLINEKKIRLNEHKEIIWLDENYSGRFDYLKELCNKGLVVESIRKENSKHPVQLLVWNFNPKIFQDYTNNIYILTYLFEGSYMYFYFQSHGINYTKYTIHNNTMVDYDLSIEDKSKLKELIHIYEGKLNNIGKDYYSLSKSWFDNPDNKLYVKQLQRNIYNFLRNIHKAKKDDILWTTFKDYQHKLKGNGYSNSFVQCSEKGSNEYGDKTIIAYGCNRFFNPDDRIYFQSKNVNVNEDIWSLSEMIQFIWRSAIRNGKEIYIYIPSSRMRNLLIQWLEN